MYKEGDIVTWRTKSGGREYEHTGKVIRVVPKGKDADRAVPPGTSMECIKYISSVSMQNDRVLICVEENLGGRVKRSYYAPPVKTVSAVGGHDAICAAGKQGSQ